MILYDFLQLNSSQLPDHNHERNHFRDKFWKFGAEIFLGKILEKIPSMKVIFEDALKILSLLSFTDSTYIVIFRYVVFDKVLILSSLE